MKKHLLIMTIILLTFKTGNSQTNVYHPFPDSNATWIGVSVRYWPGTGSGGWDDAYNLYISGDTTIGIYNYHKLYKNGHKLGWGTVPETYYYGWYAGAFRQDNQDKKIYLNQNGADTLAYNFNLNVGDTMPMTSLNGGYFQFYIHSIDSVLIGTQYHKRFWLNNANGTYGALIEGVGNSFGAFAPIQKPTAGYSEHLSCMRINNQIVWTSPDGGSCGLISINENSLTKKQISILKNPFSSETTLKSISNLKNAILTIYNSSGQQVKQIKNINGLTITLYQENLSSGLYYLRLIEDNKTIAAEKLIIID